MPQLTHVIRAGSGVDNMAVPELVRGGIRVDRVPVASQSVAEFAIGLILSLFREIPRHNQDMKRGEWGKNSALGCELNGTDALIVGFGEIGALLSRLLISMGARVSIVDRSPEKPQKQQLIDALGLTVVSLADGLRNSTVCVLCCPGDASGSPLLAKDELELMQGGFLVNVGRGTLISEAALLRALDAGNVAGAALDVHCKEPPGCTNLISHPRVIATPHIGAQTLEAKCRVAVGIRNLLKEKLGE